MEEIRDEIAKISKERGLTEDEARVFYHLDQAAKLYVELPGVRGHFWVVSQFLHPYKVLTGILASRVANRIYEGWDPVSGEEPGPPEQER